MQWILGILALPIVFWTLFALECWWLIWATEDESLSGAFWAILCGGGLAVIEFGSFTAFFGAIKANPMLLLIAIITYLVAGTAWSFFKWYLFVGEKAKTINLLLESGITKDAIAHKYATYDMKKETILETNFACLAPNVKEYKKKITTWIILWVPSSIWFLVNDPIRRTANWIYDRVKGLFQAVSDRAFKSAFKVD
jgi:hypothetical protein